MKNTEFLNGECDKLLSVINSADEVILYGQTIMCSVLQVALHHFGVSDKKIRVFDNGKFINAEEVVEKKRLSVIILCGLREKTRNSMQSSAKVNFESVDCFDFQALSDGWMDDTHRETLL